jgi:putative Mg2+ transporter-C (MgtC) family protein
MQLSADDLEMTSRLLAGLVAGALIGYERSYHGRPAGFRTHALVCMASSLLMLVTVYESQWVRAVSADAIRLDPTRIAQGIMTGIGFLGAGAILKEGLTIRGLTTAASIWITSAIGILAGIGLYFPMAVSVLLTLGVLAVFRRVEALMPTLSYYHFEVRFVRPGVMTEEAMREFLGRHGFSVANLSHRVDGINGNSRVRRYGMVLQTRDQGNASRLADALEAMDTVLEFRIAPTGD